MKTHAVNRAHNGSSSSDKHRKGGQDVSQYWCVEQELFEQTVASCINRFIPAFMLFQDSILVPLSG